MKRRKSLTPASLVSARKLALAALVGLLGFSPAALAQDASPAPILQYFEGSYNSIENRTVDIFKAGYGIVYTPPPGRADTSNFSTGYDQYDRFDLGKPGNPTLYGTDTGLKSAVANVHKAGLDFYVDLVINHNGYSTLSTYDSYNQASFYEAGGYPGMNITLPNAVDGDFNSAFEWGDVNGRLAGLIDIDHATNYQMIRTPVDPNDSRNIRPGTKVAFGRLANVADPNNRRFYPDKSLQPIIVFDPKTGEQGIKIYPFNPANTTPFNNTPTLYGTPEPENVTGYLMRNTQWLVQSIGIDGFRIDAAKHVQGFELDYFDRSVYRQSTRYLLNGQQRDIFSFQETFDGNNAYLQTFVVKTIDKNNPGRIGGNRDALNFPALFALNENLTGNGFANNWFNVKERDTFDLYDDGKMNGSQGVRFVQSHDTYGPYLNNVAHAYTLMMPGNAVVYFNAGEFGTEQERGYFPKAGRGDALGGHYGNTLTDLVKIRNVYGQGDYRERWIAQNEFAFERSKQAVTLLSNRTDDGYDSRTVEVDFNWGEYLVELTGNARKYNSWHGAAYIPEVVQVFDDYYQGPRKINVRFLRGNNSDIGYLVYGLQSPQGSLQMSHVDSTISSQLSSPTDFNSKNAHDKAYANATQRVSDIKVIKDDRFGVTLNTDMVKLLGSIRDRNADGDNAMLKIDEGVDINRNGRVDYTAPGTAVYGFEEFTGIKSPGLFNDNGNGQYQQLVDVAALNLSEGMHYLTVRAFRHRTDGGPAVYTDWREAFYVDRFKPISAYQSNKPVSDGTNTYNERRDFYFESIDLTADNLHVFIDLPAAVSEEQIRGMVGAGSQADKIDRHLFKKYFDNLANGNHVFSVVTYEITGTFNVQRFAGVYTNSILGRGLGDVNLNGNFDTGDLSGVGSFEQVYYSRNTRFNAAADLNGDGLVDGKDLLRLEFAYTLGSADAAVQQELTNVLRRRADLSADFGFTTYDIDLARSKIIAGVTPAELWTYDINSDGSLDAADLQSLVVGLAQTGMGDTDLDGAVDRNDVLRLLARYGSTGDWIHGNLTLDANVNYADLQLLLANFNGTEKGDLGHFENLDAQGVSALRSEGFAVVPEPTSAVGVIGLSLLVLRRRRRSRNIS